MDLIVPDLQSLVDWLCKAVNHSVPSFYISNVKVLTPDEILGAGRRSLNVRELCKL